MKQSTLKKILGISDKEFMRILDLFKESDEKVGGHLMDAPGVLFDISLYSFYPILFFSIFHIDADYDDIILHSRYYSGWVFILDKIYDETSNYLNKNDFLVLSTSLSAADYYLHKIMRHRPLQEYQNLDLFRRANDTNLRREVLFFKYGIKYSDKEIDQYCIDKYALAKAVVHICFVCANKKDKKIYNKIILSHDYFAIARQFLDEIEDYEQDYSMGKFNVYANELIVTYGKLIKEVQIKRKMLSRAYECLQKAIRCVDGIPESGWKRFLIINLCTMEKKLSD